MKASAAPPRPSGDKAPSAAPAEPFARAMQTKRFAEQVNRAEARAGPNGRPERPQPGRPERETATPAPQAEVAARPEDHRRQGDDDGTAAGAGVPALGERSTGTNATARAESPAMPGDQRQIERMAAAIAEARGDGAEARCVVEFPPGLLANAAVVARDAAGALVLRIVGLDERLSARQADRLRTELAQALARRRVRVSRIDLDGAERSPAAVTGRS